MSTQLVPINVTNLPAEVQKIVAPSLSRAKKSLQHIQIRHPRIKIGHSNQSFAIPDGPIEQELECWIVAVDRFMEYYPKSDGDDEDNKIPECAAVRDLQGSKYGDCNLCPHFEWKTSAKDPDKRYKECASSYRLLIAVKGQGNKVYELKIPSTSCKTFEKVIQPFSAGELPLPAATWKIKLTPKKEGNQEWSLFEFKYEMATLDEDGKVPKNILDRFAFENKHADYFVNVYGALNAAQAQTNHATTPSKNTSSNDSAEKEAETLKTQIDAEVAAAEASDLDNMDF